MASIGLPHQSNRIFAIDGGIETWLMYKNGFTLEHFSAFHLLNDPAGTEALRRYYREHAAVARDSGVAYIFDSLTYRASRDWGNLLGYSAEGLAEINQRSLALYHEIADELGMDAETTLYGGCIGPRGDAYEMNQTITEAEAEDYHAAQVETYAAAGADLVTGLTFKLVPEAIGLARAAKAAGIPSVISFMLEKDGLVGSAMTLKDAIAAVDAATGSAPAYYMINCTHPQDFLPALEAAPWMKRVRGIRANASSLEHGELCQLGYLDEGDADDLARHHGRLRRDFPHLNVFGGCCGTDAHHVGKILAAVQPERAVAF